MTEPVLDVRDVRKAYGRWPALVGATFAVGPGELFGLLGPNGAGKTTLLSIIAGLRDADAGEVRVAGRVLRRADRDTRRRIGLATQDVSVYPELTGRENLHFFGRLYGLGGADLTKRVDELLAGVGLADRADRRAGTYSGGMKRRLNLAAAVVHRPTLLLLDEPTTGVDPQSRNHIFETVRDLTAGGMTVVYTSHYMEEVQALCPRIAVLDRGTMLACDTLPNLLKTLDAGLTLVAADAPPGFGERLAALPGVKRVSATAGGWTMTTEAIGPLLPHVAEACRAAGVSPTRIETSEPTLEKVFLHLTGHALRD